MSRGILVTAPERTRSGAFLFNLFHPGKYGIRDALVGRVDGKYFSHVTLTLPKEHGWAMIRTCLAELVVKRLIERTHSSIHARIQFRRRQENFHVGLFQFGQA